MYQIKYGARENKESKLAPLVPLMFLDILEGGGMYYKLTLNVFCNTIVSLSLNSFFVRFKAYCAPEQPFEPVVGFSRENGACLRLRNTFFTHIA